MIKKLITGIWMVAFMFVPLATHALDLGGEYLGSAGKEAGYKEATATTFSENIGLVVNIVLSLVGVVFTVLLVYAGYLWMTARGDEGQVDKAKDIVRETIIGIIITLAAYSITNFIIPRVLEATIN